MSTIRSGKLRRAGASSNGYLRSIYGCSQDGSPTVLVGTNSTVPPWRASRTTLMTRFIMRSAILSGSVGSSGARPAPPAPLDVSQPPGARVDQAPYPQPSLSVSPYPDQRPLRVGRYREPPELPRVEGELARKREPLQTLGRLPLGVEECGLGEDRAEDDRTLLLAQHARLVAGVEEALQRRGVGQRPGAARGLRHVPPLVSDEPGRIPRA